MKTLNDVFLVLHIIGVGALLSGFFYQLKDMKAGMKVNAGIIHGAWLMLITGFAWPVCCQLPSQMSKLTTWF